MIGRLSGGNNARIRIAVLDDYWHIARDSADWLSLDGASVVFCHDTLTDLDAIVERLQPYFVPVRPISYLRTSSRVLSGFTSRTCSALFIEIFISHLRVYRSSGLTLVQAKKSAIPGPRAQGSTLRSRTQPRRGGRNRFHEIAARSPRRKPELLPVRLHATP